MKIVSSLTTCADSRGQLPGLVASHCGKSSPVFFFENNWTTNSRDSAGNYPNSVESVDKADVEFAGKCDRFAGAPETGTEAGTRRLTWAFSAAPCDEQATSRTSSRYP